MSEQAFVPTMYLKQGCPFCFKLRLFLLEAGLLDQVALRQFVVGTDEERAIRAELVQQLEKVSFPAAQIMPGQFMRDGDAIIGRLAGRAGIDPANLPTLQAYIAGPLAVHIQLYQENVALKNGASDPGA